MNKMIKILKTAGVLVLAAAAFLTVSELVLDLYAYLNPAFDARTEKMLFFSPILHPYFGNFDGRPSMAGEIHKKNQGDFNILIIGGSTAQGSGASVESLKYHHILEKILNSHKEEFPGISRFFIYNEAHHGYHTTQDRNLFVQYVANNSDIDMMISIDGFNNMIRPLENSAYGLPYEYPGWYWILVHRLSDKNKYYSILPHYHSLNIPAGLFKLRIFRSVGNLFFNKYKRLLIKDCYDDIIRKVSSMPQDKQIKIIHEASGFYERDIVFMNNLAEANNIIPVFVLQPLMGYERRSVSESEQKYIKDRGRTSKSYDFALAPYEVWADGQKTYREIAARLKAEGINILDSSDIYYDAANGTHHDLMHMSDMGQKIFADYLYEQLAPIIKSGKMKRSAK